MIGWPRQPRHERRDYKMALVSVFIWLCKICIANAGGGNLSNRVSEVSAFGPSHEELRRPDALHVLIFL